MNTPLATLDVAIIILYVASMTLLGVWFARRQRDVKTYFVGDRNVGWGLVLISIVATETSAVTFLSVPGVAFNIDGGNLTFLQLAFGYVVGRVVAAWLLLPAYFGGELFTAYQVLRQRFNPAVQRTASALFLATRTVADGLRLFLTALLMETLTGWDMVVSIFAVGAVTIVYTFLGGMQAVIWTDVIQFVVKILGAAVAGLFLLTLLDGGTAEYLAVGEAAGKFRVLDFSADPTKAYTFWAGLIGGAFFSMASHGVDQMMVQRYLCARSLRGARAALVLSGLVVLAQFLMFLLLGVGLYVLYQAGKLPVDRATPKDAVFGVYMVHNLPAIMPGLLGLVVAAVLAAAMSTLASSFNSSANAVVTDFYKPLRPGKSEAEYLFASKALTVVSGLAQMGVALGVLWLGGRERSAVDLVLTVAGFTTGIVLGLFFLGRMRRPVSSRAALTGMVVGFLTVLAVWLPAVFPKGPRDRLYDEWSGTSWAWAAVWVKGIAWPWFALIGSTVTAGVALVVDRLIGNPHGSSADRSP